MATYKYENFYRVSTDAQTRTPRETPEPRSRIAIIAIVMIDTVPLVGVRKAWKYLEGNAIIKFDLEAGHACTELEHSSTFLSLQQVEKR